MSEHSDNNALHNTESSNEAGGDSQARPATEPRRDSVTGRARGSRSDSEGAPPCNTAPDHCNSDQVQILRTGIDSLYLSFKGNLYAEMQERLEALKAAAQSYDPNVAAEAKFKSGEHVFEVKPKGNGRFAYVIADNWYYIKIASAEAERMPLCHVQISSELLTNSSLDETLSDLHAIVRELGVYTAIHVSRVDLCCDFTTEVHLQDIPPESWIRLVSRVFWYRDGDKFTGISFGKRKTVRANLYNKTAEIKVSGKEWLKDIWWLAGWGRESTVWRLEFQFYRDALKKWNIDTIEDLLDALNGLWAYATCSWLRLGQPTGDKTRCRWRTDPFWAALQSARFNGNAIGLLTRVPKSQPPSDEYLFTRGIAGITSYMATRNITDVFEAAPLMLDEANNHHAWKLAHLDKIISLKQYAYEKARQKARRYCVRFGDDDAQ